MFNFSFFRKAQVPTIAQPIAQTIAHTSPAIVGNKENTTLYITLENSSSGREITIPLFSENSFHYMSFFNGKWHAYAKYAWRKVAIEERYN